jgi:hypothetical protein
MEISMSKIHNLSDDDIRHLSDPEFGRAYLIGMISAFAADDNMMATDAERLAAIRACLAAYRSCQHQVSGAPGFSAS